MNRRNFMKLTGLSSLIALFPSVAPATPKDVGVHAPYIPLQVTTTKIEEKVRTIEEQEVLYQPLQVNVSFREEDWFEVMYSDGTTHTPKTNILTGIEV